MVNLNTQRLDQWLWHVRIFKTRKIASKEIELGNIKVNSSKVKKTHHQIEIGYKVQLFKNGTQKEIQVLKFTTKRISAKEVDEFYLQYEFITDYLVKNQNYKYISKNQRIGKLNKKERRIILEFKEKNIFIRGNNV